MAFPFDYILTEPNGRVKGGRFAIVHFTFGLSRLRKRSSSEIKNLERENEFLKLENEYLKKSVVKERGCLISELSLWSLKNLK